MRWPSAIAGFVLGIASQASAAPVAYQYAVSADGPALYYQFNETTGPLVNHGSLGASFDGTCFGTLLRGAETAHGDAGVYFDSSDDYIASLGSAPAQFTGNPTFSIELIVRIPAGAASVLWPPFLHWGTASPQTGRSAWFGLQNNRNDRSFVGFYNSGLRASLPLGLWHHLVG